jgi:hypothetical protein
MSKSTDNWMTEEGGIPHKNGSVRFYLIGIEEGVFAYLGWFDMTDWDKGWGKVWEAAQECHGDDEFQVIRHDQLLDLASNVKWAFEEALEDKDETTWLWWYKKERAEEKAKGEKK